MDKVLKPSDYIVLQVSNRFLTICVKEERQPVDGPRSISYPDPFEVAEVVHKTIFKHPAALYCSMGFARFVAVCVQLYCVGFHCLTFSFNPSTTAIAAGGGYIEHL
jgi:hypothetical protein